MEKRLSLTIDPTKAKQGAKDVKNALVEVTKQASKLQEALKLTQELEFTLKKAESKRNLKEALDSFALKKKVDLYTNKGDTKRSIQTTLNSISVSKKINLSMMVDKKAIRESLNDLKLKKKIDLYANKVDTKKSLNATLNSFKLRKQVELYSTRRQARDSLQGLLDRMTLIATVEFRGDRASPPPLPNDGGSSGANGSSAQNSRTLQRSMMGVGIAASMFSGTMIIEDLLRTADAYTALQNKLVVVTGSTEGLSKATSDLVQVAFDSRTSLAATVDLYSKLSRVNKQFAYSQREILTITETVSKAVAMSGASTAAAEGAVIQFAQALAGDFKTSGQELNSILEQTPGLSEALADGLTEVGDMGVVTSSQLKKLASEGLISTKLVMEGLIAVSDDVSTKFDLSLKTVAQSWTSLTDAFTVSLGKFNQASGVTKALSSSLDELTQSFIDSQVALGSLVGLMTGGAILAIGGTAAALGALIGLPILAGATAFLALTTTIGALTASMNEASDSIKNAVGEVKTLSDTLGEFSNKSDVRVRIRTNIEDYDKILGGKRELESRLERLKFYNPFADDDYKPFVKLQEKIDTANKNLTELDRQKQVLFDLLEGGDLPENGEPPIVKALEDLDTALLKITDPEKYAARKKFLEQMKELGRIEKVAKEQGGISEEQLSAAKDQIWLEYTNNLKGSESALKDLNTAFEDYLANIDRQISLVGASKLEISQSDAEVKAKVAFEKQYGDKLKENIWSKEKYNKEEAKGIELAKQKVEQLHKETEALKAKQKALEKLKKFESDVAASIAPSGLYGDFVSTQKKIAEARKIAQEYDKPFDETNADMLYVKTFEGISEGISDGINNGDWSTITDFASSALGDAVGKSIGGANGAAIGNAIGGSIANAVSLAMSGDKSGAAGSLAGAGIGALVGGPAGALIGSSLGGAIFGGRETKQTGTGYKITLDAGDISSAFTTESFKKSGGLLSSSKSWTDYLGLTSDEIAKLNNSLDKEAGLLERNAEYLGVSFEDYTGVLESSTGSLSDAVTSFADIYAASGFTAIEQFSLMGESAAETFTRLGEEARVLAEGFTSSGINFDSLKDDFIEDYTKQRESFYKSSIKSLEEEKSQLEPQQFYKTHEWKTKVTWYGHIYAYRKQVTKERKDITDRLNVINTDLRSYYEDLGNVEVEAAQEFNEILYGTVSKLQGVSRESATQEFNSLVQSYVENFFTDTEQLLLDASNAADDIASIKIPGINLSTTTEAIRELYDNATDPEDIAKILSSAEALGRYNEVFNSLNDQFIDNYYTEAEKLQKAKDDARKAFEALDVNGITLSSTDEEIKALIASATGESQLNLLAAANAIADYNKAVEASEEEANKAAEDFSNSFVSTLTSAFDKLVDEIDNVSSATDKATELLQRQRAEQTLQNALQEAQATGDVNVTPALEEALRVITKGSEDLYSDYASYMRSLGTSANIIDQLREYGAVDNTEIPQFADGGYHSGGMRLVGERGMEVEATNRSQIVSNGDTKRLLDNRPVVQELKALRKELAATQMQLVKNSSKLNSDMSRVRDDINRIRQIEESATF